MQVSADFLKVEWLEVLRGINPAKHKHDNNFVAIRDKEMSRYKKRLCLKFNTIIASIFKDIERIHTSNR